LALWDIGESSARLRTAFRVSLSGVRVSSLDFDVPEELEVTSASASVLDDRGMTASAIGLRDWRRPTSKRLQLVFQTPIAGHALITLEFIPRQSLAGDPILALPTLSGEYERDRFAAVRLRGWEATVVESRGLEPIARATFRDLWRPVREFDSGPRLPDFAFRQRSGPDVALRLALRPAKRAATGEQRIRWVVGPQQADLEATATWIGLRGAGLVEWDIAEAVNILDVRGHNVRSWSRTGSRLQIWLDRNVDMPAERETVVQLVGSAPAPPDAHDNLSFSLPRM